MEVSIEDVEVLAALRLPPAPKDEVPCAGADDEARPPDVPLSHGSYAVGGGASGLPASMSLWGPALKAEVAPGGHRFGKTGSF
jgi:hypothetical protein